MEKLLIAIALLLFPLIGTGQDLLTEPTEKRPLDGVAERRLYLEKKVLPYPELRENDLLWEKYVWRLIDTREKINLPFRYPKQYFFDILREGIERGKIQPYSPEDDEFRYPLGSRDALKDLSERDTIPIYDPNTLEETLQVVENVLDPGSIVRFRIKEVWYFDQRHGTLKVRILGIAPLITERDEAGNFKYERPMFWLYYPDCREWLARHQWYDGGNDHQVLSWEDLFELRRFAGYIIKENNILDERLEDRLSGLDRLLEADRIDQAIFDYEHDLWSY